MIHRPSQYLLHAPEEGKYHDFDEENQNHFNLAASQFYKMLLHKPPISSKPIENKSNALASVEYVVNPKTLKTFNAKKKFFQENKREVFEIQCDGNTFEMFESMRVYIERSGRSYNYLPSVRVLNVQREEKLVKEERDFKAEKAAASEADK